MTTGQKIFPWIVAGFGVMYLLSCAMPTRATTPFDLTEVDTLPVVYNGRTQPLDSLARNALMIISGRQTFVEEIQEGDKVREVRQPAIVWLMDVWALSSLDIMHSPAIGKAAQHKVFRIENEQVLNILQLKSRPGSWRYSLNEIQPSILVLSTRCDEARAKGKSADLVDEKLLELERHLGLFIEIATQRSLYSPSEKRGENENIGMCVRQELEGHRNIWGTIYVDISERYRANDPVKLTEHMALVQKYLQKELPNDLHKAEFEAVFNRFAPFYNSIVLYIFVFTLACLSWLAMPPASLFGQGWSTPLRQSAFALCIVTFIVHTWALIARMYLMGRWGVFVTNLYSSAIFIGWGCVGLGLVLEYIFQNGIGCVVGSVTGSLSLIIAHFLSLGGDTLEMLVAVLDTNFWLATHVTCITFGYTATFVAGFLGIGYVLAGVFAPNMSRETSQNFTRMLYGVVCFATLLSFTGTVLGGIWADQSWGRFWGWDPKENGALLIVLMNALILHARWGGMVKARGMAVLAILGNIVVAWSWFGVNMLGVGLHSYGFFEGAVFWMCVFVGSQLGLAILGMFDPAKIRSFFHMIVNGVAAPPAPANSQGTPA